MQSEYCQQISNISTSFPHQKSQQGNPKRIVADEIIEHERLNPKAGIDMK